MRECSLTSIEVWWFRSSQQDRQIHEDPSADIDCYQRWIGEQVQNMCKIYLLSLCEVIKGTDSVADRKLRQSNVRLCSEGEKRIRMSYLLPDRSGIAVPTSMMLLSTSYYLWNYSEYSQAEISLAFVSWFIKIKKKRQSVGWSLLVIDIWRFDIKGGLDGSGERIRASIWTSFSARRKVNRGGGVDIRNWSSINWREDIVGVPLWASLNTLVGRGLCVFGLLREYETLKVFKPPMKSEATSTLVFHTWPGGSRIPQRVDPLQNPSEHRKQRGVP